MALRAFADGALFAETIGDGPPRVLALHGWGRRGADYRQALAGMDALAVDLPGFGATPLPEQVLGAEGYARLIEPILDEMAPRPVVVGHSFGGRVAVCLAAASPQRLGPLVLTGAPLVRITPGRAPSVSFRLARGMNRIGLLSDRRMESIRSSRGSADYRAASGILRDILVKVVSESYESELRALDTPVTLIWGSDDREVPPAVAERALAVIREAGGRAEIQVLPDVGHFVPTEAPAALGLAVARALES